MDKLIRIIIIAGETSGDIYGAQLMSSLSKKYNNNVEFWGVGGSEMIKAGLNQLEDSNNISVVGFSEVFKKLPYIYKLLRRICLFIIEINPADIILIDFPGFNLTLSKKIKKIKPQQHITYFISPQIWAWNEGRIKKIKRYINKMLVIFPFEELYYNNRGVDASYIGHPFLDNWEKNNVENIKSSLGCNNKKIIGIFPGSRIEEIKHHLPIYLEACKKLKTIFPDAKYMMGLAPNISADYINSNFKINSMELVENNSLNLLECADVAIVTSGTISLQAAFMLTPCIVGYKLSKTSWLISKFLVKINFISMANIISNKIIYKELLQSNLNTSNICEEVDKIINNYDYVKQMKKELNMMKKEFLTKNNAIENAANIIFDNING